MKGFNIGILVGIVAAVTLVTSILFFPKSPVFAVIDAAAITMVAWHLKNIFGKENMIRKLKLIAKYFNDISDDEKEKILDLSIYLTDDKLQAKLLEGKPNENDIELIICHLNQEFDLCKNEAVWTVLSVSISLMIMALIFWILCYPMK